ncbi:hypothetical protein BDW59DRAFT_180275 [Aspergillus cavernicola]|uniref:Uncharacterized protein n=1 Tax=Aspergillus cavernicola TaxID=176166 RepID=A0ABR4I9R2_9EURO
MKPFRSNASKEGRKIAARFMVDEAPGYHKALVEVQPDEICSPALRNLQHVLEAYNTTADAHLRINLQHCTFAEVLEEIHRQKERYVNNEKGALNAGRNGLRIAGDYSNAISPWLDLINHGIAKQNADNREKIFSAFHDIIHIIVDTTVRQDQFAWVQILKDAAIPLYITLVDALVQLIYHFHGPTNPTPNSETAAQNSERFSVVNSQVLIETYQNTKGLVSQTPSVQATTGTIVGTVDQIASNMSKLQGQSKSTNAKIDRVIEEFHSLKAGEYRRNQEALHSQEAMIIFFVSDMPKWWGSRPAMSRAVSDPGSFIEDVDCVIQELGRLDGAAQTQAQQLLSSPEFFKWIGASHTRSALPLSAVCATLSLNLSKNTDFIVVLLIAQLLLTGRDFNLHFINTRQFSEQIEATDLAAINHTFRQLTEQLPCNVTLVCIIHGLVRFESTAWLADLSDVIYTLNQVVHNSALHPVVKLLVTTPFANSQHVGNLIQAHQTLTLRQTVVHGSHRIAERSMADRRDRLREYRMAMEQGVDSEDDSDDCYGRDFDEESGDDCQFDDDDDDN